MAQSYVGLNLVAGGGGRGANCGERLGDKMKKLSRLGSIMEKISITKVIHEDIVIKK